MRELMGFKGQVRCTAAVQSSEIHLEHDKLLQPLIQRRVMKKQFVGRLRENMNKLTALQNFNDSAFHLQTTGGHILQVRV